MSTEIVTIEQQNLVEQFDSYIQQRLFLVRTRSKRMGMDILTIGQAFEEVRQHCGEDDWLYGQFIKASGYSRRHAGRFAEVYRKVELDTALKSVVNTTIGGPGKLLAIIDSLEDTFDRTKHGIGIGETDDYHTPPTILASVWQVMTIDVDPASDDEANETVQATTYYTEQDDGLQQEWHGNAYLNPPHKQIESFLNKLFDEYQQGHVTEAIALLPDRSEADWYKRIYPCWHCRFLDRQSFIKHGETEPNGKAPFGSVALYLGDNPQRFAEVFSQYGPVYPPISEYIPFDEEEDGKESTEVPTQPSIEPIMADLINKATPEQRKQATLVLMGQGVATNQNGSGTSPKSGHKGHGGGGHDDGLLPGFHQIPTVKPGKQTYAIKEKQPPLDSGRRFYLVGVEHWPSGDNNETYSYAFCESEIKGVTQAWIRHCQELGIDL